MVLSSFLLLSFFLFLLVWSFFYLFSFWFFFLEFFLLCVRFPLSLFSYEKCFCAHVQTWPRRYRDHADHEPDDPGPGWEVRNEDSISARLSLRAVWTIRVRMRRLNSGLSVWRGLEPISKVMPRLRYRLVVCLSSLMDTACDQWSIRDHFGSGPISARDPHADIGSAHLGQLSLWLYSKGLRSWTIWSMVRMVLVLFFFGPISGTMRWLRYRLVGVHRWRFLGPFRFCCRPLGM